MYWLQQARALPPINDITTDLDDPPEFRAIVPLRAAPFRPRMAARQRPMRSGRLSGHRTDRSRKAAGSSVRRALAIARAMGWTIVPATASRAHRSDGDDRMVRLPGRRGDPRRARGAGSRVDIRSHSRVGRGDLGANARRVRDFSARLRS